MTTIYTRAQLTYTGPDTDNTKTFQNGLKLEWVEPKDHSKLIAGRINIEKTGALEKFRLGVKLSSQAIIYSSLHLISHFFSLIFLKSEEGLENKLSFGNTFHSSRPTEYLLEHLEKFTKELGDDPSISDLRNAINKFKPEIAIAVICERHPDLKNKLVKFSTCPDTEYYHNLIPDTLKNGNMVNDIIGDLQHINRDLMYYTLAKVIPTQIAVPEKKTCDTKATLVSV